MPVTAAPHRHLLDVAGLSWSDLKLLLDITEAARRILRSPAGRVDALKGVGVTTLFYEASTRTRISFENAAKALGANVNSVTVASSSIGKGESLVDTVKTLRALGSNVIVLRHERAGAPWLAARVFDGSVLNAGDGWHAHPTQALLDLSVLLRNIGAKDGTLKGRRVAIIGDLLHSRVVRSNLHTLRAAGAAVRLAGPAALTRGFAEAAARSGSVTLCASLAEALEGADAVMALRIQRERLDDGEVSSLESYREAWGLTEERIAAHAARGCVVLHPGPMNEGVEIDPDVADGSRSLILEQVAEGIPVRMAALWRTVRGDAALIAPATAKVNS
ncbi:MAG: aspartate carbamoyltransferase catalytic subunit [Candidatus Limnocylindrus sp.]